MILITSAAYVNSEFQIEFGKIPPSFLPVGNKRLFEHQINLIKRRFPEQKIFISCPTDYKITEKDRVYLSNENISIVQIDPTLSLGNSLARFIDGEEFNNDGLKILHGDTLVFDMPLALNCIGTARTLAGYDWEVDGVGEVDELVWCGFFSIENVAKFRACIDSAKGKFVEAVHLYDQNSPLEHIEVTGWYDFGHINTYFQNRTFLTTERSFNSLKIENGTIKKYGSPAKKIQAEGRWFKNIPAELKIYIPNYINDGEDYYELEYLPLPPLNELYVHGKNIELFWVKVFNLCDLFFNRCSSYQLEQKQLDSINLNFRKLLEGKTRERFSQFCATHSDINLGVPILFDGVTLPCINQIIEECISRSLTIKSIPGISHGDFCLSNILFDSRIDRLKVIDPRGLDAEGCETILGDINYDIAKLTHSVIGLYDFIIAGAFDASKESHGPFDEYKITIFIDERVEKIQKIFMNRNFIGNVSAQKIMPMTILLFFSMLPLHGDDPKRQVGLLANAIRLFKKFIYIDKP